MTSSEFMYMIKNVFTFVSTGFRAFVKSALLQNVCTFVIRCVLPTLFNHKYRGQIMGGLVQPTKLLDHFSPKKTFRRHVFSSLNVNKENPVEILPTYAIGHSPIVHYIRCINWLSFTLKTRFISLKLVQKQQINRLVYSKQQWLLAFAISDQLKQIGYLGQSIFQ